MEFKEWADGLSEKQRVTRLRDIEGEMLAVFNASKDRKKLAKGCAKLLCENKVLDAALKECAGRYLEITGRGRYGAETESAEYQFFKRLGENRIIEQLTRSEKE